MSGIRQRRIQANYLKVEGKFEFLGTGFTDITEKPNANVTKKRYINDASSSQSITSYEWSSDFEADQIKSDKAIKYISDIGELCKTGSDCETEYLIVDLDKKAKTAGYRARKFNIAIKVDSYDNNDGELQCKGSFLGLGDPVEGTVTIAEDTKEVTFEEGFEEKTLEFSYTATGDITDISVDGVTYDTADSKFKGIPVNTISFTFKDNGTEKTATLGSSWTVA